MFQRMLTLECIASDFHVPELKREPTEAEKKRERFGTMFTLHQLLNRAGVAHENSEMLTCSGYRKSKERF